MAFGYEIMRGRHGVSGHCRESEGKTVISVRGMKAGETCALYALTGEQAIKCCEEEADGNGQAAMAGQGMGPFFVASGGKVRLWQGGEDLFLRASEWLERETEKKTIAEQTKPMERKPKESPLIQPEEAQSILEKELKEIQTSPLLSETQKTDEALKESNEIVESKKEESVIERHFSVKPESSYILRSPGSGEPVDTLP